MTDGVEVSSSMAAGTRSRRNGVTTGTLAGTRASASCTTSASVRVSSVSTRTHRPGDSCQYRLNCRAGATSTVRRVPGCPRTWWAVSWTGPARSAGTSKLGGRGPTRIVTSAPRTGSFAA